MLEAAAIAISYDEPALSLWEGNLQSPGSRGWHRYQIIRVIRHDRPAEYREDLGLADSFVAEQFYVCGGTIRLINGEIVAVPVEIPYWAIDTIEIFHTVGELRDIADWHRMQPPFGAQVEPLGLVDGYENLVEKSRPLMKDR